MPKDDVRTRSGLTKHPARHTSYIPATPADWSGDGPVDVAEALDETRSLKREHHVTLFSDARGVDFDEDGIIDVGITTVTTSTTLTVVYTTWLVDATAGSVTITLPSAAANKGRVYHIKKIDATGNVVTIDGNGAETIDGDITLIVSSRYDSAHIVCDGSNWNVI